MAKRRNDAGFSTAQVVKLSGLTERQVTHWWRTGIAMPGIAATGGSGSSLRWSFVDIVGLRAIGALLEAGLTLQKVRKVLPAIQELTGTPNGLHALASAHLIVHGDGNVAMVAGDGGLVELLPHFGQMLMAATYIALRPAVIETQRALRAAGMETAEAELREARAWVLEDIA